MITYKWVHGMGRGTHILYEVDTNSSFNRKMCIVYEVDGRFKFTSVSDDVRWFDTMKEVEDYMTAVLVTKRMILAGYDAELRR